MFRLLVTQSFHKLYTCGDFVASCVTKKHLMSFLPACHPKVCVPARCFSTGRSLWKDAPRPVGDQTLDLDKWKHVMRSKAASEEKLKVDDELDLSDDDDDDGDQDHEKLEQGVDSLEATRDLVAMWRLAGKFVPQEMTDEQVQILSELTTRSSRKKYMKYLAIKEGYKRTRKEKQQQKKEMREQRKEDSEKEDLKNSLFIHYWSRSLDKLLGWRCAQAMRFNQPLVFDMSYESYMSKRELDNTVTQLMEVEGWNRRAIEPFHLHFCNLKPGGAYEKELIKRYGAETWENLLITSTEHQHVDVFPREQLVYLTADSPNVLRAFDHSKVYIVGALVDRSIQTGLSLANAKRLKLATARLPLDEFLHWETGAKNLTLDQVIRIMHTIKETGNWKEALEFVPKRKHIGFYPQQTQKVFTKNTNHQLRGGDEHLLGSIGRNTERTFKNVDQSLNSPSDRSSKSTVTRTKMSLKSNTEGRKNADKKWWSKE